MTGTSLGCVSNSSVGLAILIIRSKNTENAQEFLKAVVKVCFSFHSLSVYVSLVT